MARLNEPPAAPAVSSTSTIAGSATTAAGTTENVEALKRRFIRQNRDLAKSNSNQSLRIRALENEVSRLLQDNLDLRGKVLELQNELYDARCKSTNFAAAEIKEELQAKLAELGAIIDGIEEAQTGEVEREDVLRDMPWPVEATRRERQPLAELMRDAQMPTINEDKQYPRRTLETREVQAIRLSGGSSNESPDLGPPPVSRFDYESTDPIKFQPAASTNEPTVSPLRKEEAAVGECDLPPALSINLETRRKRRDGQARPEARRKSILPPPSPSKRQEELPPTLRTGAKRKLADRDADKPIKPPSKGDFSFSRKISSEDQKSGDAAETVPLVAPSDDKDGTPVSPAKAARTILGEKSVNMSPRKIATSDKPDKSDLNKPTAPRLVAAKERQAARSRRVSSIPMPSPKQDEILKTVDILPRDPEQVGPETQPITPAPPDFFSPTPSEPSARPEQRAGTPPPSDMSITSTTTDGGGVRPSRRARSAVNYAEPSLVSKMRRPDKKLVDAISGLQDHRRSMSVSSDKKLSVLDSVVVKDEPKDDDEVWKHLPDGTQAEPGSPLHSKGLTTGRQLLQDAVRDASGAPAPPSQASASATALSCLVASSRTKETSPSEVLGRDIDATARRLEELDLYDFKESSPASTSSAEALPSRKSHRRHSSVPKDLHTTTEQQQQPSLSLQLLEQPQQHELKSKLSGTGGRTASRRRSMML